MSHENIRQLYPWNNPNSYRHLNSWDQWGNPVSSHSPFATTLQSWSSDWTKNQIPCGGKKVEEKTSNENYLTVTCVDGKTDLIYIIKYFATEFGYGTISVSVYGDQGKDYEITTSKKNRIIQETNEYLCYHACNKDFDFEINELDSFEVWRKGEDIKPGPSLKEESEL